VAEKTVIGINIFLLFILLFILTAHFIVVKSGIDLRSRLSPSPYTAPTKPDASNNEIDPSLDSRTDPLVDVPQPTKEEEVSADQPRALDN